MLAFWRRRVVLTGSALLLTLALGTGVSSASSARPAAVVLAAHQATARQASCYSPVGLWNGTVQTTIPTGGTVVYKFNSDDTVEVIADGTAYPGMWKQNADCGVFFEITLPETDSAGNLTGFSYAEQNAVFTNPNSFTSSGTTRIWDLNGNVIQSFDVYITATRKNS